MALESIKLDIIQWIAHLQDEKLLKTLLYFKKAAEDTDWWDALTTEQKKSIEEGLKDLIGKRVNVVVEDGAKARLTVAQANAELAARAEHKQLLPASEDSVSETVRLREEREKQIAEYIAHRPKEAGRLLKVWLAEA